MDFSSIPLWIQVHDLPIEYMLGENAKEIRALVGKVLDVDLMGDGKICMSKFLRVKVEIKVENPLWSGFFLDRKPQPNLWIQFKYERIAEFCFQRGRLEQLKAKCTWWNSSDEKLMHKEPYGFGPWMKAELINKRTTKWVKFIAKAA